MLAHYCQTDTPVHVGWAMECDQTVGPNHTHKLFEQLADITHAFNACNLKHVVLEGTLVGALRDHAMNKHEVQKITRVGHNSETPEVTILSPIPFYV